MKTTYYPQNDRIAFEECATIKEFLESFTKEMIECDDYHITICYKDGSFYSSFDSQKMPKKTGIVSGIISGDYGYTYYNAVPRFEEDDGEFYAYCDHPCEVA